MTSLVIFCVDAGGTRCRGRLYDDGGGVLAQAEAGPCNPLTDLADAAANLTDLWQRCVAHAGRDPADTNVAFSIGGAGLFTRSVREAFLRVIPEFTAKIAMSDGYAALIGAGGGVPTALIIAGTGVVAHRLYEDGRSVQRDGWGWIAGDRGSGAWLGQRALRHALAAVDGLVPRDALAEAVLAQLHDDDIKLGGWLVGLGPSRLGALAPLVLQAADAGAASARAIMQRATEHFAALAGTLDLDEDIALYMAGGLATTFRELLAARLSRPVLAPAQDALAGCRLVAIGAAPPEVAVDVLGFSASDQ